MDIKRLYLPGMMVMATCPGCSASTEIDLGRHYLSYPTPGEPKRLTYECNCGREVGVIVRLSLSLDVEPEEHLL